MTLSNLEWNSQDLALMILLSKEQNIEQPQQICFLNHQENL